MDPSSSSREDQLRLRREARQNRIRATGSDRLNRITATFSGHTHLPTPTDDTASHPDPPSPEAFEMCESTPQTEAAGTSVESVPSPKPPSTQSNPLAFETDQEQLFAQMMSSMGRGGADSGEGSFPPGVEEMISRMMQQQSVPGIQTQFNMASAEAAAKETVANLRWKFAHLLSLLFLVLYVGYRELTRENAFGTPICRFSKLATEHPSEALPAERIGFVPVFWYFATIELILQSTRLILQGSIDTSAPPTVTGPINTIYRVISLLSRYRMIWNTLIDDVVTLLFSLGVIVGLAVFVC